MMFLASVLSQKFARLQICFWTQCVQITENHSHGDLVGLLPFIGHTLACGKLFIIRMAQDPGGEGQLRMSVVTSHSPKLRVSCVVPGATVQNKNE